MELEPAFTGVDRRCNACRLDASDSRGRLLVTPPQRRQSTAFSYAVEFHLCVKDRCIGFCQCMFRRRGMRMVGSVHFCRYDGVAQPQTHSLRSQSAHNVHQSYFLCNAPAPLACTPLAPTKSGTCQSYYASVGWTHRFEGLPVDDRSTAKLCASWNGCLHHSRRTALLHTGSPAMWHRCLRRRSTPAAAAAVAMRIYCSDAAFQCSILFVRRVFH